MSDFVQARKNMVDCQVAPAGIISPGILEAFSSVPRELFVAKKAQNIAYFDEEVQISNDRFLLDPITHSRMLQALDPGKDDVVLDIGAGTGYTTAILCSLVSTVIALEESKKLIDQSQDLCSDLDFCNIVTIKGKLAKGCAEHAPYDLIFFGGAVAQIPEDIVQQLTPKGKMILIHKPAGEVMGQVKIIENLGEKGFSSYTLFEAAAHYLPGFEPQSAFTF